MLKSWETSPFQSATDATTSRANTPYTDRMTASARAGRSRQRPENPRTAPQSPRRRATQSANCPSRVMESSPPPLS